MAAPVPTCRIMSPGRSVLLPLQTPTHFATPESAFLPLQSREDGEWGIARGPLLRDWTWRTKRGPRPVCQPDARAASIPFLHYLSLECVSILLSYPIRSLPSLRMRSRYSPGAGAGGHLRGRRRDTRRSALKPSRTHSQWRRRCAVPKKVSTVLVTPSERRKNAL